MIYIPDLRTFNLTQFSPQQGHEQAGGRPALVISPSIYNGKTDLAILCPITDQIKDYPFEVKIPCGIECFGCYSF